MFKVDSDKTIHVTRGDIAEIGITAKNNDDTAYTFQVGDVVRLRVFKSKDCSCIVLTKSITIDAETTTVEINLTHEDTQIGELINKPVTYWYEVELNPDTNPQTIIGYTLENGPRLFILLPEGSDNNAE